MVENVKYCKLMMLHGKYLSDLHNTELKKSLALKLLTKGNLYPEIERFHVAIQDKEIICIILHYNMYYFAL